MTANSIHHWVDTTEAKGRFHAQGTFGAHNELYSTTNHNLQRVNTITFIRALEHTRLVTFGRLKTIGGAALSLHHLLGHLRDVLVDLVDDLGGVRTRLWVLRSSLGERVVDLVLRV